MIYYKGYIVSDKDIESHREKYKIGETRGIGYVYNISDIELNLVIVLSNNLLIELPDKVRNFFAHFIYNIIKKGESNDLVNSEMFEKIRKLFAIAETNQSKLINSTNEHTGAATYIIYELVKDEYGNLFGKELHTKELFPIYCKNSETFNYAIEIEPSKSGDGCKNYYLKIEPNIEVSSLLKTSEIIVSHTVADQNDVEDYLNRFNKKGLFKRNERELESFKKQIITLANKNVFREDFSLDERKEKPKVEKEKQSSETTLMEDIDYSLMKLKNINKELYLEYKNRYESLLENDFTINDLIKMAGELEFYLIFRKREIGDILEILNSLKKEYFNNLINNSDKKTDLDIKKLDKINELFLKIKDKYSYKNQREVLRNLAFLYLMETYENIDLIDIEELEHSYFITHLKTIVIWINLLIEENIIECSYLTSLREEINVKIVLDMINNIKFKKIDADKVKKLIIDL